MVILSQLISQNNNTWDSTSNLCIKLVTVAWALNLACSILLTIIKIVKKIREFISKYREKNAQVSFTKVHPEKFKTFNTD